MVVVLSVYAASTVEGPDFLQFLAVERLITGSVGAVSILGIKQGRCLTKLQLIAHPATWLHQLSHHNTCTAWSTFLQAVDTF